ncbi:site-specific DNA-methyltransferase [Leptospira noguchii]|nr:DNA methyltransferase [Leptospira noguchii]UOG42501.1 site-specific DNA-methyltransferase [Leptospira noguchii]
MATHHLYHGDCLKILPKIPDSSVLDNCMGHGTTGIASIELERNFIGIERDKDYFQKAKRKIKMAETRAQLGLNFE